MPQLKKEQMLPGAIVEVLPVIKDGVPGFGLNLGGGTKEHLTITREAGSVMDGGWGATSGTRLEIVQGPKRRQGINTVIVKVCEQPEIVGHVYWCELRASGKLISAAPTS